MTRMAHNCPNHDMCKSLIVKINEIIWCGNLESFIYIMTKPLGHCFSTGLVKLPNHFPYEGLLTLETFTATSIAMFFF
jgi:hypothetical protein